MNRVSVRMAPFHPKMVLFDTAAKRVVFGGPMFICRNIRKGAPGCIMLEVGTTLVVELVSLSSCSSAGSGRVISNGAAVDAV